jgi:hypothetical protein
MDLGRELERIIAKSPPPAETGTGWTEREIQRGVSFRRRPDGEVVAFAICADCKNGFMGKLYYGKFRQLCRDCWFLSTDAYSKKDDEDQERVLRNMGGGEWVIPMLARSCKLTNAACEQALLNLATAGKVERRGRAWARVEVKTT